MQLRNAASPRPPLTNAFGTRLDPDVLLARLDSLGLPEARLVVTDDEVVLACADPDIRRDDVARGLTWLRTQFSPLVPMRTAALGEANGARFVDERTRPVATVALSEIDPGEGVPAAVADLIGRLGARPAASSATTATRKETATKVLVPVIDDPAHAGVGRKLAAALADILPLHGMAPGEATISAVVPTRQGMTPVGPLVEAVQAAGPHFFFFMRPGGATGMRPATVVAASWSVAGLRWLLTSLREDPPRLPLPEEGGLEVLFDGLAWRASRRPIIATDETGAGGSPIRVALDRCTSCGVCAEVCPEDYLGARGLPATDDTSRCTRCYDCIEACPTDALRPTHAPDTATLGKTLAHRRGWLSRITGAPGPSFPGPFPPSYLLPKPASQLPSTTGPRYVLGLAVMTMQEHAAVLLKDGEIVGAIEHEKLVRIRHGGWHPPDRPGVTAAVDPTICLEETFCRRPIRALLEEAGITLDDLEVIAVNGLHGRYVDRISFVDENVPIPKVRTGRVSYLPHHLCHAASAFRRSGAKDGWVFTVDGRGDRECAAVWRATDGHLEPVDTLLSLTDRSIGGVYEGVTRLLGFGSHGQGSVMALASFGTASDDLKPFLRIGEKGDESIHESGIDEQFAALQHDPAQPLERRHQDLAASLQAALESAAVSLVGRSAGEGPVASLSMAGGVTLNCKMNERLRRTFKPKTVFVQAGANDAGTALGAAFEAWSDLSGQRTQPVMDHAYFGPSFTDEEIEPVLRRAGLRYRKVDDVAEETAALLADGKVVCWFQGRMEFGPRALGARSIVADPRNSQMHEKVNRIKDRESWRPFGPSILSGHEGAWLDGAFDARFMLFTMPVLADKRHLVPAVVHVDGTTRPQVVHAETAPRYHAMIDAFHRRSGVPMVLNTSFNRRGEPIVCTPKDAVESFLGLGADVLAIGDFLVEPVRVERPPLLADEELARLPGNRRLSLRLTTKCDLDCGHCTLRDERHLADRPFEEALRSLAEGRSAGCDELVILRGESVLRQDLPLLVARARRMGYRFVQLQTNAHAIATVPWRDQILKAGIDSFEVMLLAADEALHDSLAGKAGSFRPTMLALRALAQSGRQLLVTIPVVRRNMRSLSAIVALAQKLGVKRIQFNFPRPVELPDRVLTDSVPRLADAAPHVNAAAKLAAQLGMSVSTEAFPFCHLPPELRAGPKATTESTEDWSRHRIDDLHLVHDSLDTVRKTQRPEAPPCRECTVRETCPKTWALYLELFGSGELKPI